MEDKKEINVISGDGSNIEISPVYEHIKGQKPKTTNQKPNDIIVPKEQKKK